MKFLFGTPTHGWMNVTVSDQGRDVVLIVSDVPCNSIYKLAKTLLSLQSGAPSDEVEFSLEPDYAKWVFVAKEDELELNVYPDSVQENPIIFSGEKKIIMQRLYKGLRDFESLECWKEPDAIKIFGHGSFHLSNLMNSRRETKMHNKAIQHGQFVAPEFLCGSLRSQFHTKIRPPNRRLVATLGRKTNHHHPLAKEIFHAST